MIIIKYLSTFQVSYTFTKYPKPISMTSNTVFVVIINSSPINKTYFRKYYPINKVVSHLRNVFYWCTYNYSVVPRAIRKSSSLEIASMAAVKPATIFSNGIDGVSGLPMTCSGMYGTWINPKRR